MKLMPITEHDQGDVAAEGARHARMRMLIGPQDGATRFHMRHFEIGPGGCTPHHQHDFEHEVLILKGTGIVRSGQGERTCRAGDVVWMPPNELHQFQNPSGEPLEFICVIPAPRECT